MGTGSPDKAAILSICVNEVWGEAKLGQAATTTGTHKGQDKEWPMPGPYPPVRAEIAGRPCRLG